MPPPLVLKFNMFQLPFAQLSNTFGILYMSLCVYHLKRWKTSNLLDFRYSVPLLGLDFIVLHFRFAGGQCTTVRHCPTKTVSVRGDTGPDQLCVPASNFIFSRWALANPRATRLFSNNLKSLLFLYGFRNVFFNFQVERGRVSFQFNDFLHWLWPW